MKNCYIVLEGMEKSGKTTATNTVYNILKKIGIKSIHCIREPGSTKLGETIRNLIKFGIKNEKIVAQAELFMMYAARAQLVEQVINPLLKKGYWIISDRNEISSQAYQGAGRNIDLRFILNLKKHVLKKIRPDLIIYLDITPELCLKRININKNIDIFEKESINFFYRIYNFYIKLTKKEKNIIKIDANQPLKKVNTDIKNILLNWINILKNKK
ncbi:MAG: dTMP kinase [Arsenophonus sp.]|nr:MAG: dTMP kinase [Arsenophonus sp.]